MRTSNMPLCTKFLRFHPNDCCSFLQMNCPFRLVPELQPLYQNPHTPCCRPLAVLLLGNNAEVIRCLTVWANLPTQPAPFSLRTTKPPFSGKH